MLESAINRRAMSVGVALALMLGTACQRPGAEDGPGAAKIPVTTDSEEARKLFLEGRDLNDRLRFADAHEYFEKAGDFFHEMEIFFYWQGWILSVSNAGSHGRR